MAATRNSSDTAGMKFKARTLNKLAAMICGDYNESTTFFRYRSSSYLTEFFRTATQTTRTMDQPAHVGLQRCWKKSSLARNRARTPRR